MPIDLNLEPGGLLDRFLREHPQQELGRAVDTHGKPFFVVPEPVIEACVQWAVEQGEASPAEARAFRRRLTEAWRGQNYANH